LFFVIIVVLGLLVVYDILTQSIGVLLALGGILVGIIAGLIAGRMFDIKWHETDDKIVSRMDKVGALVLIAYLLFAFFRNSIFSLWVSGNELGVFGFCVVMGVMIGRLHSTKMKIRKLLVYGRK
jgi:hypothetical protein